MNDLRKLIADLMRALNIKPPENEAEIRMTYSLPTRSPNADMEWLSQFEKIDPPQNAQD